jgi:hypothetical protein
MANKGYLLSQKLLDETKATNEGFRRLPNKASDRYIGDRVPERYFAKIGAVYEGSDWTAPEFVSYEATQVITDSAGQFVGADYIWGDEADSASFSPIIDLTHYNYKENLARTPEEIRMIPDTIVEVFQKGGNDGDTYWYTYGAKAHEYQQEVGYNLDSEAWFDSEGTEAIQTDSGWVTDGNNSGFVVTVQTRSYYSKDSEDAKILYGYYRDFTYNAMGVLVSMTVERRQVIDNPMHVSFGVDKITISGVDKVTVHSGTVFNDLTSNSVNGADFSIAAGYVYVEYYINLATDALTVASAVQFVAGARPDEFSVSGTTRTCKIPLAQITSGGVVTILHHGDINANQDAIRTFELFPVNLSGASGSAGNATTQCAFTYTVKTIGNVQLLTTATPVWNRPAKGKMVAGTSGTAYFNDSNVAVLYQADEVPFVAVCP